VELTRRNIPFVKFGGLKFLEAAHIKDILALLRFVENPRDRVAGFRVMQLMPGVGSTSAQRVLDHMMASVNPIKALIDAPSPPRAGDNWISFVTMSPTCTPAALGGRPNSSAHASGTNRISSAFTKMRSRGAPISCNSSRLRAVIPRASGF
jgi:hypothetical protein